MTVLGLHGEELDEAEQAALELNAHARLLARDMVRARAERAVGQTPTLIGRKPRPGSPAAEAAAVGTGRRLVVRTMFQVEPVAYSAAVGGPWETLVAELRPHTMSERHDGDDELLRLRWPDRDFAELAHAAVCRSLETTNLYQVVERLRLQVRAHVSRVVAQAVQMDRERARREGGTRGGAG
jgi:hypothetical protein